MCSEHASSDSACQVWDTDTLSQVRGLAGHNGFVNGLLKVCMPSVYT